MISSFLIRADLVQREFNVGDVHTYRIHVDDDQASPSLTLDYTLWTKCKKQPSGTTSHPLEIEIRSLKEVSGTLAIRKGRVGIGTLNLDPTGLPLSLRDSFPAPEFWGPLETFYLPDKVDLERFDVSEGMGASSSLTGKGTIRDSVYNLDGQIDNSGGSKTTVKLNWTVDDTGWLVSGEGTITEAAGTVHFTIKKDDS